jgi:hypothetical protein
MTELCTIEDVYLFLKIDNRNYFSRERDVMRRKHAARQALRSLGLHYKEIARIETELFVTSKPVDHTTIMNSINQPYDTITSRFRSQAEEFLSQHAPEKSC